MPRLAAALTSLAALLLVARAATAFELTSSSIKNGEPMHKAQTCDGDDVSPPLEWSAPPERTRSLALTCDDPDAPAGRWTHWVVWGLPVSSRAIDAGAQPAGSLRDGIRQGRNSFGTIGYRGPCPPAGSTHHYVFRLLALDVPLDLPAGATQAVLEKAVEGHVIGRAELTGTYARP